MSSYFTRLSEAMTRKKNVGADVMETELKRCLNTVDVTLLGIGHMVGAGIYVLTGFVIKNLAGPATPISYAIAGLAALFSAMCYAEFGARVPKAGSAYTYTYVAIGEFWSFTIGWTILLEHLVGVASIARAFGGTVNALSDDVIKDFVEEHIGEMDVSGFSEYPDFVAATIIMLITVIIAIGVKFTVRVNAIFTSINICVMLFIISTGLSVADFSFWTDDDGFMPYGVQGVLRGAATCFYAYVGFEGIAIAAEEAVDPNKSLPPATYITITTVSTLYIVCSGTLTLMVPYDDINIEAPFPSAFEDSDIEWARLIVGVGSMIGLSCVLLGTIYTMGRTTYAMAKDGLLFQQLAYVHPWTQTPIFAILVCGLISAAMSVVFRIEDLAELMSIGALMAFTFVAISVLVLRYRSEHMINIVSVPPPSAALPPPPPPPPSAPMIDRGTGDGITPSEQPPSYDAAISEDQEKGDIQKVLLLTSTPPDAAPSSSQGTAAHAQRPPGAIVELKPQCLSIPLLSRYNGDQGSGMALTLMGASAFLFAAVVILGHGEMEDGNPVVIIIMLLSAVGMVTGFMSLTVYKQNVNFPTFHMPCVPLLPSVSILFNILLILSLSYLSWIRVIVWLLLGFLIYFLYGIEHSLENKPLSSTSTTTYSATYSATTTNTGYPGAATSVQ